MLRDKIFALLVTKYPGAAKKFLGLLATQIAKKVTEESKIEEAITSLDEITPISDLAADFQKEADRRITDAKKEWEKKNPAKGAGDSEGDDEEEDDDSSGSQGQGTKKKSPGKTPAWAEALIKSNEVLNQKVEALTTEKAQNSIQTKLAEKLKDKVPAKFYAGRALPAKEEELDDHVAAIEKDYTEFKQDLVNQGLLVNGGSPLTSSSGGSTGKEKSDIKAWAEKKQQQQQPAAASPPATTKT